MGLDMYLEAERTVAGDQAEAVRAAMAANPHIQIYDDEPFIYIPRWSYMGDDVVEAGTRVAEAAGIAELIGPDSNSLAVRENPSGSLAVSMTVIYWRKANAIHQWFVENVQDNTDDCGRYVVHPELLMMLRANCAEAGGLYLAGDRAGAADILTPTAGFFFGSTDVDEWYAKDLADTMAKIDQIMPIAAANGPIEFYYQSSW